MQRYGRAAVHVCAPIDPRVTERGLIVAVPSEFMGTIAGPSKNRRLGRANPIFAGGGCVAPSPNKA